MEPKDRSSQESTVKIKYYTFEEFVEVVRSFHGFEAVGVLIGGFMVDEAYRHLPQGRLFDALCETPKCLPDAVQLLTPCTLGNGWLSVVNVGRYALTLYDKETGVGVRVFIDPAKLEQWPEIRAWFFKLKTKKEQDLARLLYEAKTAGASICGTQLVKVPHRLRDKKHRGQFAICPQCKESYPFDDGLVCLACSGEEMYEQVQPDITGEQVLTEISTSYQVL
ncbi:MAG: formylmethanofuran dehydrogenase subunit region [Deltaproteobacteria bacterium]|nr:formylmethanofuran dehydrogenase subunit region [Deltaproteobacteria bacterium]